MAKPVLGTLSFKGRGPGILHQPALDGDVQVGSLPPDLLITGIDGGTAATTGSALDGGAVSTDYWAGIAEPIDGGSPLPLNSTWILPTVRVVSGSISQLDHSIMMDSSVPTTLTLPPSKGLGFQTEILNVGTGPCAVTCAGSDKINGASSGVLYQYNSLILLDGRLGHWSIK